MSLYRPRNPDGTHKSPYWHFDQVVRIDGQSVRVHGSTGEKQKARAKIVADEAIRRAKTRTINDGMTLAQAAQRYCDEVVRFKPSADDTERALEHCCRLIGGSKLLIHVTPDDISTAMRLRTGETKGKHTKRPITPTTANRQIIEPMRSVLRRARRVWGVSVAPDLFPWADLKLDEPKERVREFTTEEAQAFWSVVRPDYLPLIWFLAHRGFRVNATLGMRKARVDLEARRVQVWRKKEGLVWQTMSRDQVAVVSAEMKKAPLAHVWTYVAVRGAKKGTRHPITYAGLRRVIHNALEDAGITDFRVHDLRHDFASKLLRRTRDLALVRKALGHADIASTARYAHVLDEDIADGMDEMSRNSPGIPYGIGSKAGVK